MRTVTFSNPEVASFLNENFVSAWFNRGPGFCNKEFGTEEWIFRSSYESYPTKNICTFFLKPDGCVFTYAAGYHCPALFLEFSKAALKLQKNPHNLARRFADQLDLEAAKYTRGRAAPNWCGTSTYRGKEHAHGPGCSNALGQGLSYLAKVCRDFGSRNELPRLKEIQKDYLFGNPFTEESGQTATVDPGAFVEGTPKPSVPPRPVEPSREGRRQKVEAELEARRQKFEDLNNILCTRKLDDSERVKLQNALVAMADGLIELQRLRANLSRN